MLINLSETHTAEEAWHQIGRALGCDGPVTAQDLAAVVADQEILLILDDCDLLASELSLGIAELLATCPGLRITATSRTPIDIYAEHLFLVQPLRVASDSDTDSDGKSPAVQLFEDRLREQYCDNAVLDCDLDVIAEICALLDGLPLAIELTARSIGTLTLHSALDQLRQGNLTPPSSRLHDTSVRQRSMEDALSWTDGKLGPEERELIQRLSCCEAPFDLDTAEYLGGLSRPQTLRLLDELVHKGLLLFGQDETGEPLFRVLSATRSFYRRQLSADRTRAADARARHARRVTAPDNWKPLAELSLDQINADTERRVEDVRTALLPLRALGEHLRLVEVVLALENIWIAQGRLPEMADHLERSVEALGADGGHGDIGHLLCRALETAGRWRAENGQLQLAERAWKSVTALYEERGDRIGRARTAGHLGDLARRRGHHAEAGEQLTSAAGELSELGDERGLALVRRYKALLAHDQGAPDAENDLRSAIASFRSLGEQRELALSFLALSRLHLLTEKPGRACQEVRSALSSLRQLGGPGDVAAALEIYGCALYALNARCHEHIARMLVAADALRSCHALPAGDIADLVDDVVRRLRTALGPDHFSRLRRRLRSVRTEALMDDALSVAADETAATVTEASHDCLTPRQTEIALMVAEGMTNRQIANRLSLSEWTVVNHLRQVMQKLEAPSRVHVARHMQQQRHNQPKVSL
ncbi:LuxR C-terminal-related transcriptional regulator [Streptomyces sp. Go-475]|uniref:ATP-binding protein n=1 Tax=Streptomyces sp. Go-475 TaxID=2072505 RepID=UPI0013005222|nr:LuxR C-terminal-related transcriptional regulator [Streptomyces sp. Go-475]